MTNLTKCQEAIEQDQYFSKAMMDGYFSKSNGIFTTEDLLLELAATDVCNGIFYASIIKLNENEYISRYFEHGSFCGFFETFYLKASDEFNFAGMIPYCVYTDKDVKFEKERHGNQYLGLRNGELSPFSVSSSF